MAEEEAKAKLLARRRAARTSKEERLAQQQADLALRNAAAHGDAGEIARLLAGKPTRLVKPTGDAEGGYDGDKSGAEDDSCHDPNAIRASAHTVDEKWETAAHKACQVGSVACLEQLIAAGANVNAEDKLGRTPSWYAACYGGSQCLEALIVAGADLQKADQNEITPIFMANANGHTLAISVLNRHYKRPPPSY